MTSALRIGSNLLSVVVLVAVNLVPLIGVAFWGWSLMLILVLYWVESGIVGVINVFKIARAEGPAIPGLGVDGNRTTVRISRMGGALGTGLAGAMGKGALIAFFVMHYGIFWLVHGVFVFLLPLFAGLSSGSGEPTVPGFGSLDFGPLPLDGLALSAGLLATSHVVSFFANYLGRGEYLRASPTGQMLSVYGRVVVLHVTIVAGAFVIGFFGTPIAALVLLVGLKTLMDLAFHLRSHRVAAG
ncbi:MAG: DUF6498-containing protein [Candidatus Limnocylindria bacterium]